jgi:hypothetical protein
MEGDALKEAFVKTEKVLGLYFAGQLSGLYYAGLVVEPDYRERFDFFKKSAEAGCSWGQVEYGRYFEDGEEFVEQDTKVFLDWLEKAANQNNPKAMDQLGDWFGGKGGNEEKTVSFYRAAAELGWKISMNRLAKMLRKGKGCVKDLRPAVIWGAKGDSNVFWNLLAEVCLALESGATEDLDCDLNQLCFLLGWGLFWYQYETKTWNNQFDEKKVFGELCLDYYCSCVELQQESILTFLLCWNRATGGVQGPGQMIAQMVWEGREDNLVMEFE